MANSRHSKTCRKLEYTDKLNPVTPQASDSLQLLQTRAYGSFATAESIGGSLAAGAPVSDRSTISGSSGASPSNTAPHNYIPDPMFKLLHQGVDSLYLSFKGELSGFWASELDALKRLAQDGDPHRSAQAQITIDDHCFEVQGRGKGKFAFVIVDHWFHIQIASPAAKQLPVAYVQISSELLSHHPLDEVIQSAKAIIDTLASRIDSVSVSRLDLCADFLTSHNPQTWSLESWVTRAHKIDTYSENQILTGWSIGSGGCLMARLYNKTVECKKSHKRYFYPIWIDNGWNEEDTVWRLEFQFKKDVLTELELTDIDLLDSKLSTLWHYATEKWLRLTVPNKSDSLRSRWDTHPLWLILSGICWKTLPDRNICRVRKERIPSDDYLFTTGLGAITSYMARENIVEITDALTAFIKDARRYHESKGRFSGQYLHHYVKEKRILKNRKFNTLHNKIIQQREREDEQ